VTPGRGPAPRNAEGVPTPPAPPSIGVRLAGVGSATPERRLTNQDLETRLDTSNEWIVQRTGIHERRICDPAKGESVRTLSVEAVRRALADARLEASELDLVILGTISGETRVPAVACRVAAEIGAGHAGALDLLASCSGFVYGLNIAHDLIRSGAYRNIAVIGCDTMSAILDPTDRRLVILFGDAAGAAVVRATDDTSRGLLAQSMHADGGRWQDLYMPYVDRDLPKGSSWDDGPPGCLRMNGREVYKFAVKTFGDLIAETLEKAGLSSEDVDQYVCHQSNARILESSRERFGIPADKMYVNIDRYGNSSAGSVPLCLAQLKEQGRLQEGDVVMFVAFGAGLTWASSLWRL